MREADTYTRVRSPKTEKRERNLRAAIKNIQRMSLYSVLCNN